MSAILNRAQQFKLHLGGELVMRKKSYDVLVKHFLVLFLIVLLPLRGWSADDMAIQMASMEVGIGIATMSMPVDCPMMGMSIRQVHGDKVSALADQKHCQSCQLCMSLSVLGISPVFNAFSPPRSAPSWAHLSFTSADILRVSKPPIV